MDRCALCPGKNNCVPGDGPEECGGVYGLGEAPGGDENRRLLPFQGRAGQELNEHYLRLAGIPRERIRINNVIHCLPDTAGHKLELKNIGHKMLAECCANAHLYPELKRLRPKIIIAMGAFACYALDPDINLELHHGKAIETKWGTVFVMYHPAGGMHEPKKMLQIRSDWIRFRRYLDGKLPNPVDQYADSRYYKCLEEPDEVDAVLHGCWDRPMGNDTEYTRFRKAFCHTFSAEPGTGFLLRAENKPALAAFQRHLDRWKGPLVFHHWLHDKPVTEEMGLRFPAKKIHDTMLLAFHLGNIPQGLKALAYRLLGMEMQDFDDLVTPYSTPHVVDYYRRAQEITWPKPEKTLARDKNGKWKVSSPRSFNTKLKIFFTYLGKDPDKDVFETWDKNWEAEQAMVEAELGPWPGKCITHAPFEEVIDYSCRDADGTLRLWPLVDQARRMVRRKPQESWLAA